MAQNKQRCSCTAYHVLLQPGIVFLCVGFAHRRGENAVRRKRARRLLDAVRAFHRHNLEAAEKNDGKGDVSVQAELRSASSLAVSSPLITSKIVQRIA